jgi:hypothetical protein
MPLELTGGRGMSINMNGNFIPAAATIAELEQEAAECDRQAATEPEPEATELRERAKPIGHGSHSYDRADGPASMSVADVTTR